MYDPQAAASWIMDNLPNGANSKLTPTNLSYILNGMLEYKDMVMEENEDEDEEVEIDYDSMLEYVVNDFLSGKNDIDLTVKDLTMIEDLDDEYFEQLLDEEDDEDGDEEEEEEDEKK